MSSSERRPRPRPRPRGAVAVELAFVLPMFVSLVLVTIDASRWVFALAAAGEAAREGARSAAVCGADADAAVRRRMAPWLDGVTGGSVSVQRLPSGCFANSASGSPVCTGVQVVVSGYAVPGASWLPVTLSVPTVTAYLPRESLDSTLNPAVCQ